MSFGSTRAAAAMPRTVARSKPCRANWVRAARRIFSRVPPAPGLLPVRAMRGERLRRSRPLACYGLAGHNRPESEQQQAAENPNGQDQDLVGNACTTEVERPAHRAVELSRGHPGREPTVGIRQELAADGTARADEVEQHGAQRGKRYAHPPQKG